MSLVRNKAIALAGAVFFFIFIFPVESCLGGSQNEESQSHESAPVKFFSLLLLMISFVYCTELQWEIATEKTLKEVAM